MRTRCAIWWLSWTLFASTAASSSAAAQTIVVAPHAVFIDHRAGSAVVYLYNPSDETQEVSLSFVFGYPASDTAGNVYMRFIEEPEAGTPSAAGWIQAFPRRALVAPGQRQAVRLLARPPSALPAGEYWTRLVVTTRGTAPPPTAPDTGVRVGLTLEVRTVIAVSYRKGPIATGVEVSGLEATVQGDSLVARVGMSRTGTAAYLGTLALALRDPTGAVRAEWEQPVAVYYDLVRRVSFPVGGLTPGTYRLEVQLATERSDIAPEHVLRAEPVRRVLDVRLP